MAAPLLVPVAIPKNASTALRRALGWPYHGHLTAAEVRARYPDAHLVAVIRHPVERMRAWRRYLEWPLDPDPVAWCRRVLSGAPHRGYEFSEGETFPLIRRTQVEWIGEAFGQDPGGHLLDYARLDDGWRLLQEAYGVHVPPLRRENPGGYHLEEPWPEEASAIVHEHFAEDFEQLGAWIRE